MNLFWAMMHKLRRVLSERDNSYELEGEIELDEGFYSTSFSFEVNEFTGKRNHLKEEKDHKKNQKY